MTSVLLSILLPWRKTNRWETRAKKTDKLNPWWCYSLWFTICLQLIIWCSDVRSHKGMMNSFPFLGTESNLTFFFPLTFCSTVKHGLSSNHFKYFSQGTNTTSSTPCHTLSKKTCEINRTLLQLLLYLERILMKFQI